MSFENVSGTAPSKPCRMDQLFAASTKVVNLARRASKPFASDTSRNDALTDLLAAVQVFDRLNRGI